MNIQLDHNSHKAKMQTHFFCLLAHNISSPENIGSLFRIADALGLEKIYLSGNSPIPPNPKIKKTSRSTEKYVPFEYLRDAFGIVSGLKKEGYIIISLEITSSSIDIRKIKIKSDEKICLILGSENEGINQDLLDISDHTVHIPMHGQNSSMNVATACAIACWEMMKGIQKK